MARDLALALSRARPRVRGSVVGSRMRPISYARHQFPPDVIRHAVWLQLRFSLSYRDVEELLAERGIAGSYESTRRRVGEFGPTSAACDRDRPGDGIWTRRSSRSRAVAPVSGAPSTTRVRSSTCWFGPAEIRPPRSSSCADRSRSSASSRLPEPSPVRTASVASGVPSTIRSPCDRRSGVDGRPGSGGDGVSPQDPSSRGISRGVSATATPASSSARRLPS